ncbi:PrgI family protein [bacterium]|nr:PrgI family protein [bacterium]
MEYPLPQFLEIKPKVAGPLTLRQLLYFAGALIFLLYFYFTKSPGVFLLIAIPVIGATFILAFVKVKGYPIPTLILRAIGYSIKEKVYVWRKISTPTPTLPRIGVGKPIKKETNKVIPKIGPSKSKLKELSKLVEIHPR